MRLSVVRRWLDNLGFWTLCREVFNRKKGTENCLLTAMAVCVANCGAFKMQQIKQKKLVIAIWQVNNALVNGRVQWRKVGVLERAKLKALNLRRGK